MSIVHRRVCLHCGNDKRFFISNTLQTTDGSAKFMYGLAVQIGDEEFYWIKGTTETQEGRGPAWEQSVAHIFCGPCENNRHIADIVIHTSNIKGWKDMEVLLE